jgi:outer membrane protein TolC
MLCLCFCAAAAFGLVGGCSTEHYKADADKEVYKIIDSKWQDSFGQKANYIISDSNIPPSPNDIQIEKAVPSSGVLSLARAVAIATAQSRQYQRRKKALYLAALGLTGTRHKYARQWFGTVDGEYTKDGDDEDVRLDAGGGFNHKRLLAGAIEISTSLTFSWLRYLTGDPRTSLGSVLIASATVPLLGVGGGRRAELESLTVAERRVLYEIRTFNRYRKKFVVDTVNAYYGVLQQRDAVSNTENNYKRVLESKERLEMEAQAGRRTRIDVDEAQQNVLRAQNTLVGAQERYAKALDSFKISLALPTDASIELDQNELKALEEIGISEPDHTLGAAVETALLQRLDLANTADEIDDAVRNVELAADGLGPQLNLTGGMNVDSGGETDFSQLQFREGTYTAGFNADLPFDRKVERNSYRQSLINLEEARRTYDEFVDTVKLNVRDAYRDLQETSERYKIQKNSLALAEQRVESNRLLLDAGRVTVRVLLESQDALLNAQNDVTSALVDHLNAKLSFYRDIGILQVRPDGMWEQETL